MTFITVWLDPHCWDKHFLFYNLLQNINTCSLKDILQILWNLLSPLFKGTSPSAWYQMKDRLKLNNFCSISIFKKCPQNLTLLNVSDTPLTWTKCNRISDALVFDKYLELSNVNCNKYFLSQILPHRIYIKEITGMAFKFD